MPVNVNGAASVTTSPVSVSISELESGSVPFSALEEAFGPSSLGIIVVRDLPARFTELRRTLLSYSSHLANLPSAELEKLESPASKWLVGWSCGKETLKDGKYDTLKGSYYVNPVQNPELHSKAVQKYPNLSEYTSDNVWPDEAVLPGFQTAFQDLCTLIIETATLVARACDRYALANVPDYKPNYLEHVVRSSISTKARLLHYFPSPPQPTATDAPPHDKNDNEEDDWCATHLDHGCLTGLTSAMFIDEAAQSQQQQQVPQDSDTKSAPEQLTELPTSPDPQAGLYIHARSGAVTKVAIPRDCLAFQTGEALEVITKGRFRAVPHFVKGVRANATGGTAGTDTTSGARVARNTLAVFTQPNLWEMVDGERDFATFAKEIVARNH